VTKFIIDTHILLWAISDPTKLGSKSLQVIENPDNHLSFSLVSYWEICLKRSAGKIELPKNWQKIIDKFLDDNNIDWLPIERKHIDLSLHLPLIHKDPFDRMLVAQAMAEHCAIITCDSEISKYNIKTIF
jgi:PIN domain nuclease of toxin-antitoxin system